MKEWSKQDETKFTTKKWCISEFHPTLKANVLFLGFFLGSHPVLDQTQGFGAVFS
jgi:hypothetical protein